MIYKAKPNIINQQNVKFFESKSDSEKDVKVAEQKAVKYLNSYTGISMFASDWAGLGKLTDVTFSYCSDKTIIRKAG